MQPERRHADRRRPERGGRLFHQTPSQQNPDRIDLKRGLAKSLVRAKKPTEAAAVWAPGRRQPEGTDEDRVMLADALIRSNEWDEAKAELNQIPPTHETFDRYRLEAMVADSRQELEKGRQLLRNRRGPDHQAGRRAEQLGLFQADARRLCRGRKAVRRGADLRSRRMFTAKNNLVLARAAQRKYDLPVVQMTQTERAELLYTMALAAIKQGDVIGRQRPAAAGHRHPSAAFRGRRPQP